MSANTHTKKSLGIYAKLTLRRYAFRTKWRVEKIECPQQSSTQVTASNDKRHVLEWTGKGENGDETSTHEYRQHWISTLTTLVADLLEKDFPFRRGERRNDLESFSINFQ